VCCCLRYGWVLTSVLMLQVVRVQGSAAAVLLQALHSLHVLDTLGVRSNCSACKQQHVHTSEARFVKSKQRARMWSLF